MNINYDYGYFENPFAEILESEDADFVIFPTEKRDTPLKGRVFPDYPHNDIVLPDVFSGVENPFLCKSFKIEGKDSADFEFLESYPSLANTKNVATLLELEGKAKAGGITPFLSTLIKLLGFLKTRLSYLIFGNEQHYL